MKGQFKRVGNSDSKADNIQWLTDEVIVCNQTLLFDVRLKQDQIVQIILDEQIGEQSSNTRMLVLKYDW